LLPVLTAQGRTVAVLVRGAGGRIAELALSFLVADRNDTAPAHALAAELGLALPPFDETLERWLDFMVTNDFGAAGPLTTDPSAEVRRR